MKAWKGLDNAFKMLRGKKKLQTKTTILQNKTTIIGKTIPR